MTRRALYLFGFLATALSHAGLAAPTLDDLFKAVKANDVREVRSYLDLGMDPNSTNQQGYSVLMEAAREGHTEMVLLLVDRKARLNQRNAVGETALMLAAFKGNLDSVKLLHGRGGELTNPGWTALHYAAFQGQTAVAKYLLENQANVNARAPSGITPLMAGARNGHYDVVKLLLTQAADPSLKNDAGATALQWAAKGGNSDIVQLLKQAGAKE
jgi:ankyrin repeat protein